MKRLLITGGTGYLGNELIRQSQNRDLIVAASYCTTAPPLTSPLDVYWLPLDVSDQDATYEGFDIFQPDVVIHTAYTQQGPDLWRINGEGSRSVAKAAKQVDARLIHMSSDVIFDGERDGAYTDTDTPDPITDYGRSKADAERFVIEEHPDAVIIRTSLIYGFTPIDRHTQFVLDVADGRRTASLYTDEYRNPVFVGDLALALLELADHTYCGYLNMAGAERVSRYEFGVLLARAHGHNPSHISQALSSDSPVRRPRNCTLDSSRAGRLLNTPLRGMSEVLDVWKLSGEHPQE